MKIKNLTLNSDFCVLMNGLPLSEIHCLAPPPPVVFLFTGVKLQVRYIQNIDYT